MLFWVRLIALGLEGFSEVIGYSYLLETILLLNSLLEVIFYFKRDLFVEVEIPKQRS